MPVRFAINGLGRIGRALLRIAGERPGLELVAIVFRFAFNENFMSRSIAATVFLEIVKPRELRISAIFCGVVLVHFVPVIGSPAASYFINSSISTITCGVFF